ncbi:dipicolinate synthase subunit DpsA, partial [Anaerotruncus massiliensis (ex Liu et al. 2021)]
MTAYKTFAVVGGDLRQAHVANRLAAQGKTVYAMLLETNSALEKSLVCAEDPEDVLPQCDVIIFPLPMSTDERHVNAPFSKQKVRVCDCLSGLKPGACVLGGKVSPAMRALAESCGVTIIDYFEREELCVKNAVITAEGAASIAMEELPISLFGSRCMITGHGRISKALMRILRGMGADVTVAARKHGDLAEIEAEGCRAVHIATLAEHVRGMDVLFNTVPSRILTADILEKLGPDTLLIDLASKPGGV